METNVRPFFSVAIPTWEIKGLGAEYLHYSFNILAQQTFQDFEVIISDHSLDDSIKNVCEDWSQYINTRYYRNQSGRGRIAPNMNNAINKCKGLFIKMLFQDDFLYDTNSLETIHKSIKRYEDRSWFLTACVHTKDAETMYDKMVPFYHHRIHEGANTISCPTVLTVKNEDPILFDESLNWLVDVEYYKRLYIKYGDPVIIEEVCAVNRDSQVRTTNMMKEEEKAEEVRRVTKMYETR